MFKSYSRIEHLLEEMQIKDYNLYTLGKTLFPFNQLEVVHSLLFSKYDIQPSNNNAENDWSIFSWDDPG